MSGPGQPSGTSEGSQPSEDRAAGPSDESVGASPPGKELAAGGARRDQLSLTENCLLESFDVAGARIVRRLLAIDVRAGEVALIDVEAPDALPEWESFTGLDAAFAAGTMSLREDDPWFAPTVPDSDLSEASRRIRDARLEVLRPLVDPAVDPEADPEDDPALQVLRAATRGRLIVEASASTGSAIDKIYDWLRLWWKRGQIDNALLPMFGNCGQRRDGKPRVVTKKLGARSKLAKAEPGREGMNVTEPVRQQLVRGGLRYWGKRVNGRRLSLVEAYNKTLQAFFTIRLDRVNGHLTPIVWESPADDARIPTFRQFCYWLGKARREKHKEVEIQKARFGARGYDLGGRSVLGTSAHLSKGPGHYYLIDATVADLYLLSSIDRRRVVGRPVLYLVIDHWSRMIVGLYVGFEGPNWIGAMMALENALTEKVSFCAKYGVHIGADEWPCAIAPLKLGGDRGELVGAPSDFMVPGLRLTVLNMPPARGDLKSFVEGQFKITNEKGIERTPGWVNKHRERGGPDYRLDAVLTVHEFTRVMIELALHNNRSRRLETLIPPGFPLPKDMDPRPLDLWEWGIEHRIGRGREIARERVRVSLLRSEPARATHRGFSVRSDLLLYDSQTAREQGWFQNIRGRQGKQVQLGMDDRDVSVAYLRIKGKTVEECPLTAAHREQFGGKSLDEVLDQHDRLLMGRTATRGPRAQDEANLAARLQGIVGESAGHRAIALEDPKAKPSVRDLRGTRRAERDVARREQAFTRQDDPPPALPSRLAPPDDDDEYIPFPS